MDQIGRRNFLRFCITAGAVAALGPLATRADAALTAIGDEAGAVMPDSLEAAGESGLVPTQAVVIRPGARRGPRIVIRPRRRRMRPRRVCVRRGNRVVCRKVY